MKPLYLDCFCRDQWQSAVKSDACRYTGVVIKCRS